MRGTAFVCLKRPREPDVYLNPAHVASVAKYTNVTSVVRTIDGRRYIVEGRPRGVALMLARGSR